MCLFTVYQVKWHIPALYQLLFYVILTTPYYPMDWGLGRNSKLWEPLRRIRGVVPSAGVGPKLNHSLSRCYPYYPSRETLSDHTPYLSGKDYQW